ncbi:CDP-glycerol glycerophosphotransferase family protein [Staphylococcus pasteuri]|uniref:CDP-glycerol glycerophosphotransferase family protein n=1 Tax=Staphylococcus TaxID=1279 RepID=UPI0008A159EE|nr:MULTISPECIES: CDP-glycerol glycerophosphotransferase family protein [Staphylococcus]OFV06694.1 hypothetical protein HMPREF3125_09300 [Staphylococcus sp. HMSC13A10]
MNQYIFTTSRLDRRHGGLTSSMLNKASMLNEKLNIKPLILTFHLDMKYESIVEETIQRYGLKSKAIFLNINKYFKDKANIEKEVKYTFEPSSDLIRREKDDNTIEYFNHDKKVYEVKYSNHIIREIKKYSNGNISEKIKIDVDGFLFSVDYYENKNLKQQDLYRKDQSVFASRFFKKIKKENEIQKIILFDEEKLEFSSFDEFKTYFISLFIKDPITYLVVENRNIDKSVLNIKDERVRKIFMTHSIHIRPGTDIIRRGNRAVLNNLNEIDALVLLTESQKQDIIKRFGYRNNYFVIPHAIETKDIQNRVTPNKVVMVSRLHEEKRIDQAIQAFKQVVQQIPDAVFHIYGEGKERENLQSLIDSLGITDNVKLEGYSHNINKSLQSAECTLLTSKYEGFALVIQESIANGTPVIAYDIKYGPSDMIDDGKNGYLVKNGNVDQLAQKLYSYLTKDEQEKNNFSKHALEKAEKFSIDKFVKHWNELFNEVKESQELYQPSVKLTQVSLHNGVYSIETEVKLNTKEPHQAQFRFLFYKRSTLQNKEAMEYIAENVKASKIGQDSYHVSGEFDPNLFNINEIYDLNLEIQDNTQYHKIRVGNNRENVNLNNLEFKFTKPYYTKDYENLSFDLKALSYKSTKSKYLKYQAKKVRKIFNSKKSIKSNVNKLKHVYSVPKVLLTYSINEQNKNVAKKYHDLKKLHPILKRNSKFYYKLGELAIKLKKWNEAHHYINKAIELDDRNDTRLYFIKAILLKKLGENAESIKVLQKLLHIDNKDRKVLLEITNMYYQQSELDLAVEYLEQFLQLNPNDKEVLLKLIQYLELKNDKPKAVHYYSLLLNNKELKLDNKSLSEYYYKKGQLEFDLNDVDKARTSFNKVIQYSNDSLLKKRGIGHLYEQSKHDSQAINEYEKLLEEEPDNAELHFHIATLIKKTRNIKKAIYHFEKALELNKARSPWYYQLALCYEELNDYPKVIDAYKNAILRQQTHRPDNYRRLGYLLEKTNDNEAALEAYSEAELFRKPSYMSKAAYSKHIGSISVRYAQSYDYYNIDDQMIFYESMSGAGISGNPWGVFDYIYNQAAYKSYTHVWVINSFDNIPLYLRDKSNIIYVKKNSDAYLKYISKAKYLICDSTFSDYVVRKPEQRYLQTTHGIFYKTVGRDSNGTKMGVAGSTRNLLQATHIIAPNQFMVEKQQSAYSIKGIKDGSVAKVGYPRIDITLNATDKQKDEIRQRMNLPKDKSVVLYAPTWRGESKESNGFDIDKLLYDLNALAKLDATILFRGHSITKSLLKNVSFPNNIILPPDDISTNYLMSIVDVLISDYSSVFFDFIPTERPIVHYLYDFDDYVNMRGLNIPTEDLPGHVAETTEELVASVKYSIENPKPDSKYLKAKDMFCPYDIGHSGENVSKWFFEDNTDSVEAVSNKKYNGKALFLIGPISDLDNLDTLTNEIDTTVKKGFITSLSLKKAIAKQEAKASKILSFGNEINLLPQAGPMPKTLEEIVAIHDVEKKHIVRNDSTNYLYEKAYRRERRRLFGDLSFDYIYNYEDNNPYWVNLSKVMDDNKK